MENEALERQHGTRLPTSLSVESYRRSPPNESETLRIIADLQAQYHNTQTQTQTQTMTDEIIITDRKEFYRLAALPTEYSHIRINMLFDRGYERYTANSEQYPENLVEDVERFGVNAFRERVREQTLDEPILTKPDMVAVLAVLSAICVKAYPKFDSAPPEKLQLLQNIRELYANTLISIVRDSDDRTLQQDIADILYINPNSVDEYGPHSERNCTEIKQLAEFDGETYIKVPRIAAADNCVAPHASDPEPASQEPPSGPRVPDSDDYIYIPLSALEQQYREYAIPGFNRLVDLHERTLTDEQRRWIPSQETRISERIDRFFQGNQFTHIWTDWHDGERTVRTLIDGVKATPDDRVQLGQYHTATELRDAGRAYEPEERWTRRRIYKRSLAGFEKILRSHHEHPRVSIRTDGQRVVYRLTDYEQRTNSDARTSATPLPIESLEDLFELPCLANSDEHWHGEPPRRTDLFNFVRLALWLPQYHESEFDLLLEDLKELFSRWPWYDDQQIESQLRYAFTSEIDGEPPVPLNCSTEAMQRYCIGQEQCPYSIWASLPFPAEMYEHEHSS